MKIVKVTLEQVQELQQISKQTFSDAFAKDNNPEDFQMFLDSAYSIERLSKELQNLESEFYFIKEEYKTVGYLKINFGSAQTEKMGNDSLEVERIYIEQNFHGKGAGKALMDKAIQIAKGRRLKDVWLGVWEKNPKAVRFYEKNGFEPFGTHKFMIGKDEQTDILMRLVL
jgi:diamine N-acetyltransferase